MHRATVLGVLVAAAAQAGPARAAEPPAEGAPPSVDDLLQRIERLEEDKGRMQTEIDDLRVRLGDDWLTTKRAEEMRNIVEDVLADADTRASLLQDGATAGWDGHFFIGSADGRFRLQLTGLLQLRWIWNFHDQPDRYKYGFETSRAELTFEGHVFSPDVTYKVKGEYQEDGGQLILEDAWVRFIMNDEWSVRFGQFRLPFTREELIADGYQQVIERSLVNESQNLGYSQGLELLYTDRFSRFAFAVSDGGTDNMGGFLLIGSQPQNTPALDSTTTYALTARYEAKLAGNWEQFEQLTSPPGDGFGLMAGFAVHVQEDNPGVPTSLPDEAFWFAATADVSVEWGGANLFSSFTWDYVDDRQTSLYVNIPGFVLQGGVYFTEKFEAYARFEWGRFMINGNPFQEDLIVVTMGGNYYIDGQDLKLSADIGFGINAVSAAWDSVIAGWRQDSLGAEPQVVIRTQLQLLF
jgi:hypothetical protein